MSPKRTNPDRSEKPVEWLRSVMGRYEGPLVRYAARILKDPERARDVVQETFLRLLESGREADEHLAAWLFTVCRNRALDVYRKERRMGPLTDCAEKNHPDGGASPPAVAERREHVRHVAAALEALPANQQEVLRLKFQNGLAYKEIASITGLSVSNVGFLIHVGIRHLRKQLKAAGLLGPDPRRVR